MAKSRAGGAGVSLSGSNFMSKEAKAKIKYIQANTFNSIEKNMRIAEIKEAERKYNDESKKYTKKQVQDEIKRITLRLPHSLDRF